VRLTLGLGPLELRKGRFLWFWTIRFVVNCYSTHSKPVQANDKISLNVNSSQWKGSTTVLRRDPASLRKVTGRHTTSVTVHLSCVPDENSLSYETWL
jgi:hypothetical protein